MPRDNDLTKMAYWIMCRAIERDPKSTWAKEATEQWLRYCEQELPSNQPLNLDQ